LPRTIPTPVSSQDDSIPRISGPFTTPPVDGGGCGGSRGSSSLLVSQ
jgi:hypothetical protein